MSNALTLPLRARGAMLILATAALLALACNPSGGTGTPPPSANPTPSPSSTPAPTAEPTTTPVPPSPTFGVDQIEHPTGATDIALRMEQGGGFVPMEFFITQAPQFTLYGDGTLVFRPIEDTERLGPLGSLPRLLQGKMTEDGVQALLAYALSTGRLANAKATYDDPRVADASTTTFNLNAAGVQKVVSVYALSEVSEPGPDAADRDGFNQLSTVLLNFGTQAADDMSDVGFYDPDAYHVFLLDSSGEPLGAPADWPWTDLTLDDFPPPGDEPDSRTLIMDRAHVDALVPAPNGGTSGIWVEAPDGTVVQFAVRPLLPDEIAGVAN